MVSKKGGCMTVSFPIFPNFIKEEVYSGSDAPLHTILGVFDIKAQFS